MKKFLFTSTAIVAFAGAASADIVISGNAEMGVAGADTNVAGADVDLQFVTDIDVTFTMSGETDGGLTFGASVDLDEGVGPATGNDFDDGGIAVFISGGFGTLTLGDTDGALDWALTEVAFNSGSLQDDETAHAGYNGNAGLDGFGQGDGQILRYDYTMGDFGFAVSVEQLQDPAAVFTGAPTINIDGETIGVGFRYSGEFAGVDLGFGLGYQDHSGTFDADAVGASLNSTFGDVTAGISYLSLDLDGVPALSYDHVGVGIGYSSGAISASANYGQYDYDDGTKDEGFGLSAGYDLGGGASVQFGYGDSDNFLGQDINTYSLGVRMNF